MLNTYQATLVVTKTQNKAKQELVQGTKRGKDATRFFFPRYQIVATIS
jgi:hypothetical protein